MPRILKPFMLVAFVFFCLSAKAQTGEKIYPADVQRLVGAWTGNLTYLDYRSNKPVTIPSDLDVKWNEKEGKLIIAFSYTKEPQANSVDTIQLTADGHYFNKEKVMTRKKLTNGNIEITTEKQGKDGNDNKDALIRKTYIIGENTYINRKEVQFVGEKTWIKRNEAVFVKRR